MSHLQRSCSFSVLEWMLFTSVHLHTTLSPRTMSFVHFGASLISNARQNERNACHRINWCAKKILPTLHSKNFITKSKLKIKNEKWICTIFWRMIKWMIIDNACANRLSAKHEKKKVNAKKNFNLHKYILSVVGRWSQRHDNEMVWLMTERINLKESYTKSCKRNAIKYINHFWIF